MANRLVGEWVPNELITFSHITCMTFDNHGSDDDDDDDGNYGTNMLPLI